MNGMFLTMVKYNNNDILIIPNIEHENISNWG
jgi:hypothetical protein